MESKKVKVFNAYEGDEEYYKNLGIEYFDYWDVHKKPLNKDGCVKLPKKHMSKIDKFEPLDKDISEALQFKMDKTEESTLQMFKSSEEQAKDLLDSAKRKRKRYERFLLEKCCKDLGIDVDDVLEGDIWDCHLSPFGHCLYHYVDGDLECIFCGQPEERK